MREQIETEIARFQGKAGDTKVSIQLFRWSQRLKAQVDLQTVRSNMQALHDKEVALLKAGNGWEDVLPR